MLQQPLQCSQSVSILDYKITKLPACPRNPRVRVTHRYVFAHLALILTVKWKVVES
jgi:hypothetical protein